MTRIVSLLPSSTEIVYALGLEDQLVAVTHECDYPAAALHKPRITRSLIPPMADSTEIDKQVSEQLHTEGTLYKLDLELLKQTKPDIILTQKLCDVCAVSYDNVARAAHTLNPVPQLINLEPNRLEEIFQNILQVGEITNKKAEAESYVTGLRRRVENVADRVKNARWEPTIVCLEWMSPLFCAGHWIPELVQIAGGVGKLGKLGRDSERIEWESVLNAGPDIIVVMCCGFSAERTLRESPVLQQYPHWHDLKAVRDGHIYYTDGNSYFSRPGPRIVESIEILAKIFHPDLFPEPFPKDAVIHLAGTYQLTED